MKKLKVIITIFIIAIIFITGAIVILNKNTKEDDEIEKIEETIMHAGEEEDLTDQVKDQESFFTVSSCVSQYVDLLNKNYSIYFGYDDDNNYTQIMDPYEAIIEVLSTTYLQENNITENNIANRIELLENKLIFVPLQMRVIENAEIEKYLVYGIIENLDNEYINDIYLFVNLCPENSTFSIEPITETYDDIYDINYTNEESKIEENDFNEYVQQTVDNEDMCMQYLEFYKNLALAKPELAYEFLDKEYRETRFGDIATYKNYLETNREELEILTLSQYLVNGYEEYTEYVCKDKYENLYIFHETAIMEFTLALDTYTIPTENFITTYNAANEQKKVMMNTDKWIQMLNNRDYTAAYNVLNETYRNNTFGNEEEFEDAMREKLPLHYEIEYNKFTQEGAINVLEITLKDITEESEDEIPMTIFMQLNEDLDFVMSFSIE